MTSLRVLIVDDEPLIRSGVRRGLAALDAIEMSLRKTMAREEVVP